VGGKRNRRRGPGAGVGRWRGWVVLRGEGSGQLTVVHNRVRGRRRLLGMESRLEGKASKGCGMAERESGGG